MREDWHLPRWVVDILMPRVGRAMTTPRWLQLFAMVAAFFPCLASTLSPIPTNCTGPDCLPTFSCSGTRNCTCSNLIGKYELTCYAGAENGILATVQPDSYLRVRCNYDTAAADYDALSGLRVGAVEDVEFRHCPLPEPSLSRLLSSLAVSSVETLNFRSRRDLSGAFDRGHLTGLGNLTKLLLTGNSAAQLPEDFLADVPRLLWLDLKENNLQSLPENFFRVVPHLQVLELGDNKLSTVNVSDLKRLILLNLWKNEFRNVTRDLFSGLTNLEQLDISSNSISSLPEDAFRHLPKLRQLSLYSNNLTTLPRGLLSGNADLEVFRLHDNRQSLALPSGALSNLSMLQEVYLMRNNLTSLPEDAFWGSGALSELHLRGNAIVEVPPLLFRDQRNLKILDLAENLIQSLPDNVFRRLDNLVTLRLEGNRIKRISRETFRGVYNLRLLDMERNLLEHVDSQAFAHMTELRTASFSDNRLSFLPEDTASSSGFPYHDAFGSVSPFRNCVSLEKLNLANNSIAEVFSDWRLNFVRLGSLDLSHNNIQTLTASDVHFLSQNLTVDLRYNLISLVAFDDVEGLALSQTTTDDQDGGERDDKRNVRVLLEGNPLRCDCHAYQFVRYFERKLHPSVYLLATLEPGDLKCHAPESLLGRRVSQVESRILTCPLDGKKNCPKGCRCDLRRHDRALVVNCTDAGLGRVPEALPVVAGVNHTELLLDGNRLEKLPDSTYPGYENVTHLHLSSNNIGNVGTGMLSKRLRELTLNDNNLTALDEDLVKFLGESSSIRLLTLHNNPWRCDCSARDLLDLVQKKFKEIPHLSNVTCSEGDEPLSKMSVSDLCPVSATVVASSIVAAVFGISIGTLAALYYRYHREVKVWLYSHRLCLWFVTEEELDRDKLYDAFVSYSHKDESFVVNTLVPELESGENPFKLCLHYRDWIAGEWIPNQIAMSVENSRRTLVVLSPNFLESEWSRMEFRAAHKQALSEGRARVIVVVYGDVGPTEDLDPELRAYISMNTYVKWGDPWFWGKLKYALPHPPSLAKTNVGFGKRRSGKDEVSRVDDKLELVHTLDPSSSPPGGTTPPIDAAPCNGGIVRDKSSTHLV